jgi:hypothetical protein
VKTSDHRPVSAIFDVDVEICDEQRMHEEYLNLHRKWRPSNALIAFDMRTGIGQSEDKLVDAFKSYIEEKYGSNIKIIDRL